MKLHALLAVATYLVLSTLLVAHQEQKPPLEEQPTPVETPALTQPLSAESAPLPIRLPTGQQVRLVLKTDLSSEHAKVGDVVEFEVVRSVKADGLVVIPAGTQAQAVVIEAKPHARKGVPGSLAIAFREVHVVNGDVARLTGDEQRKGADKKAEIDNNIGATIFQTFGFGAPLTPLFLLQRGEGVHLTPGTQLTAFVADDLTLERTEVERLQPKHSPDTATVYLFHGFEPTCGSVRLPFDFTQKGVVRIEVPPGQYWFHTGTTFGMMRAVAFGLTFGAADSLLETSGKKILKRRLSEFSSLDAKGGETYYLLAAFEPHQRQRFHEIEATEAEKLLEDAAAPYYIVREYSPKLVERLKDQPKAKRSKQ